MRLHQWFAILACLLFTVTGEIQSYAAPKKSVYQPVGAPADPKVDVRWNRFYNFSDASNILKQIAKAHPKLAKLQSLGKSYGKRDMWVMTITNFVKRPKKEQQRATPAFWIDGGIHANETQSVEVTLYTAWYLCEMYGRSEFITRLLDERVFYIAPMLSPDARDAHMNEPNTTHSPRTGMRPVDDDRDGKVDEDGYDDLDKDGHIVQMRIKDPHGRYKAHAEYPQLMVRVKDGEKGEYTLLGNEGFDNDGDGKVNEDGDGYYDPNRDWAWNWQPGHVQRGAHRYPFSVKENRMIADFIMAHPNIAGAQSYHNTGGMILRGPGAKTDRYERADIAVYDRIAKAGKDMLPGYRYMNIAEELYEVHGGSVDWIYGMQGAFCYTNELFTPFNYFRHASEDGHGFFGDSEERHKFNKLLLFGDGFVKWHEVDHPQYGKVEVGGFKKNWIRQPPSFLLEEECHRNMAFTLFHADQMPKVGIESIQAKDIGGGLTQVTVTVVNDRITPTRAAVDIKRGITAPDRVTLVNKEVKVILGMTDSDPLFRSPSEQKHHPRVMKLRSVPGQGHVHVRWLVKGKGPFTVRVESVKGGVAEMSGK